MITEPTAAQLDAEILRQRFEGLDVVGPVEVDFRVGIRNPGDGREEVWRRIREWLKREKRR